MIIHYLYNSIHVFEATIRDSSKKSNADTELSLLSILAIILTALLVAVFGFIFSLYLIYRRNRKRKLDEMYMDEGYKPSKMLGDYKSGLVFIADITSEHRS